MGVIVGVAVSFGALILAWLVVWARWKVRDRRRRRVRLQQRAQWRDELERAERRLRLHIVEGEPGEAATAPSPDGPPGLSFRPYDQEQEAR